MRCLVLVSVFVCCMFLAVLSVEAENFTLYRVDEGDVISINVLGHADYSGVRSISVDGTITLPFIGALYVKDKNVLEIEKMIKEKLSEGYITDPTVSVSLTSSLKKLSRIFVYGEVFRPGETQYERDMTLLKAVFQCGGIKKEALYGELTVRRQQKGGVYKNILETKIRNGEMSDEAVRLVLQPDDIVVVEKNKTFFLQGQVAKAGEMDLEDDTTLERAVLFAGISKEALYGKVRVKRKQEGGSEYMDIFETNLKDGIIIDNTARSLSLQPEDVVIIERNKTFFIHGEVAKAGEIELMSGITLEKALSFVGIAKDALYGKVKVKRKQEGGDGYIDVIEATLANGIIKDTGAANMGLQPDDKVIVERNKTFFIHGEVAKAGEFELMSGITLEKALSFVGITKDALYGKVKVKRKQEGGDEYIDVIEATLANGIIKDAGAANMGLQPDDKVIVERNTTYFVYGEVTKSGEYVLLEDTTVFKAILNAGGFTKWGSPSRISLLRLKEGKDGYDSTKVDLSSIVKGIGIAASIDPKLQPGDIVVVKSGIF